MGRPASSNQGPTTVAPCAAAPATPATSPPFRHPVTVRFADVDRAGIVYYPRFLHYCHVAMEEFFAARVGIAYPALLDEHGLGFPTVHVEIDFSRPLRYGDRVEVEVAVAAVGRTSVRWEYQLVGADGPVARAVVVTVATQLDGFGKLAVPDWLRARLTTCVSSPS